MATADGRLLVLVTEQRIYAIDSSTGRVQATAPLGRDEDPKELVVSPDGTRALVGSGRHMVSIFDLSRGTFLTELPGGDHRGENFADGVVLTYQDDTIHAWDYTGKPLWHAKTPKALEQVIRLPETHQLLVSVIGDALLLDPHSGKLTPKPGIQLFVLNMLRISPDRIASYDSGGWTIMDLRSLRSIGGEHVGPGGSILDLFPAGHSTLAVLGTDGSLNLVAQDNGAVHGQLKLPSTEVLAVSADGTRLAATPGVDALYVYALDAPTKPPLCVALDDRAAACAYAAIFSAFSTDSPAATRAAARAAIAAMQGRGLARVQADGRVTRVSPLTPGAVVRWGGRQSGGSLYLDAVERLLDAGANDEALRACQWLVPISDPLLSFMAKVSIGRALIGLHRADEAVSALIPLEEQTTSLATQGHFCPPCELRAALARAYLEQGMLDKALGAASGAIEAADLHLGGGEGTADAALKAQYLLLQATALDRLKRSDEAAIARQRASKELAQRQDLTSLTMLSAISSADAETALARGQGPQADALGQEAVTLATRQLQADHPLVIYTRAALGSLRLRLGQPDHALEPLRAAGDAIATIRGDSAWDAIAHNRGVFRLTVAADWGAAHPIAGMREIARTAGDTSLANGRPTRGVPDVGRHGGAVKQLSFSLDGRRLVSGDATGSVLLWDIASGAALAHAHTRGLENSEAVGFAPNGDFTAGLGGHRYAWRASDGAPSIPPPPAAIQNTPPQASADTSGNICIESTQGKKLCRKILTDDLALDTPGFSPDGRRLYVLSLVGNLLELDPASLAVLRTTNLKIRGLRHFVVSPNGQLAAAGEADGNIHLLDLTRATEVRLLHGPPGLVTLMTFNQDGSLLASVADDTARQISVWNTADGARVAVLGGAQGPAHAAAVSQVIFSPDGRKVITASLDQTVRIWDSESGTQLHQVKTDTLLTGIALTSPTQVLGMGFGGVSRIDIVTGVPTAIPHDSLMQEYALNGTGAAVVWSPLEIELLSPDGLGRLAVPAPGAVQNLALSPDGRLLAASVSDHGVTIFDTVKGVALSNPQGAGGTFALSNDRLFTDDADYGDVAVFDARSGKRLSTIKGDYECGNTAFAVAGHAVLTFGLTACLADQDSTSIRSFFHGRDVISTAQLSPDGHTLALGSLLGPVFLVDVASGAIRQTLGGHASEVTSLAFSPDGTLLASGGKDCLARVWDVATGALVSVLGR